MRKVIVLGFIFLVYAKYIFAAPIEFRPRNRINLDVFVDIGKKMWHNREFNNFLKKSTEKELIDLTAKHICRNFGLNGFEPIVKDYIKGTTQYHNRKIKNNQNTFYNEDITFDIMEYCNDTVSY